MTHIAERLPYRYTARCATSAEWAYLGWRL